MQVACLSGIKVSALIEHASAKRACTAEHYELKMKKSPQSSTGRLGGFFDK